MRNLFHVRWLLALGLVLGSLLSAHATHVRGGEMSYYSIAPTTTGVPRYHVQVALYCDPNSPAKQESITLYAVNGACGSATSFSVNVLRGSASGSGAGACPLGRLYQLYTYDTDLDLPPGQWTLSTTLENRVVNTLNINSGNSVNVNIYLSAYLDNTLTSQDSSPRFESQVLPMSAASGVSAASFAAFDTDADSLSYGFVLPQQNLSPNLTGGCGTPITGALVSPHYQLNQATGALLPVSGSPIQGYYNVTGRVAEYRRLNGRWQLLGYITRDLTYLTYASSNRAPAFTALTVNGAAQPLTQPVLARPGQTLSLGLTAADPDAGQQLRFGSSAPQVVPGLTLSTTSATQALVQWQVPATLPPGRYSLAFDVFDDACPANFNTTLTLVVVVTNQPLATRASLNDAHEVYPVPFREQVQFRVAPNQAVTLVDALGRAVAHLQSGPDGRVLWQPGSAVRPGLYVARTADGQPAARLLRE